MSSSVKHSNKDIWDVWNNLKVNFVNLHVGSAVFKYRHYGKKTCQKNMNTVVTFSFHKEVYYIECNGLMLHCVTLDHFIQRTVFHPTETGMLAATNSGSSQTVSDSLRGSAPPPHHINLHPPPRTTDGRWFIGWQTSVRARKLEVLWPSVNCPRNQLSHLLVHILSWVVCVYCGIS